MKTMKLESFESFQCNVSQLDKLKGGETIYTGCGRDAVNGGWVYEFCNEKGQRTFKKASTK